MVTYSCDNCSKVFTQKGHLTAHRKRKTPCKKDNTIEQLVEKKVQEALAKTNVEPVIAPAEIDYTKRTITELKALCKERNIKGISGKSKTDLIALLEPAKEAPKVAQVTLNLLEECLKTHSLREVSDKLNLCVGTVKRWQELKEE